MNFTAPEKTELCEMAFKYKSDKTPLIGHNYTPFYHDLFKNRRNEVKKVFEIGLGWNNAGSLRMWREYFPNAYIYGMDVDSALLVNDHRIQSFLCNQTDEEGQRGIAETLGGGFDLIIDDGCHEVPTQILSAKIFFPLLKPDGIYVIEDVQHPETVIPALPAPCEMKEFNLEWNIGDDRLLVMRR
jgi:hypothetical protein